MTDSAQSNVNRITVGKAAKLLGVSSSTLRRLEDSGKINSQREEENNYRFYLEEDVLGLKAELAREKVEAQVARVNSIPVEKPIVNVAGPTSRVTLAKPTVIRAKTPVATATVATAKVANAQTQDPFYTNFRKNINLITAGFAGASLLLMIFSFFMLAPYKTKNALAKKATQTFDSTGGKLAQLLNIEIQETSPFSQPIEKQMMAAVLGVRTRNPEYQVEFNVPVLANKLVTFQEGASINGTITLDTVAKTSLENTLELAGDATGTLSNVTINNLGGLALGTIEGDDGNLLYIDGDEIISGTLSDLDTTEITELGTIETGTWEADVIDVGYGGTGLTSFSTGDLIYASASSTLSPLNVGTNGHILTVTNGLPVWANVTATLGGNVFLNGGNSFGANATLGTLDAYSLALMTNNVSRLTIASTGDITINPSNEIVFRGENLYSSVLGARTYTDQRYVTNGETFTASIDALDLVVQDVVSGELGMWQRVAGTSINPATYTSLVITDTGRLGIGTTAPTAELDVKGDVLLGDTTADTIEFVARVKEGTSLVPETDISSDLGAPDYRFNNIYVANINSNSQLTSTGQAIFTYEPTDVTYAEATVRINPTDPFDQSYLLGLGVYGYQRAGFDTDGDLSLGYSGLDSIPTTNNPLNIYGHNATLVSTVDTSGNAYFAGTLGLGTTSPSAQLHVVGTTEQLRLSYDATNYTSFTIGSTGELTISDSGTTVAVLGATGASFQVPTSFNAAGDVSIANDLVFTNQETANIKSYGPLYIESGENFENNDLTLKTYGTGNVALDLTGTGYLHLMGTDPSIVFDTRTATDTDFWMGVQEDAAGTDDDKFMLGKGTVLGTSSLLTLNSSGYLGLGTTSPQAMLHVTGSTIFGTSIADTMTFNAGLASGSSLIPAVDLGSDLGSATNRFNNIYVANINSNSQLTSSGQAVFTYSPLDTTWAESTVRINPTTAPSGSWLLGMGVGGNQVAGVKNDGGAYFAGNVGIGTTAPTSKLDVSGTITATGFVLPTGAVAGYVLSTDADGNATWVDGSYSGDAWAVSGTNVSLDDPSFLIGIGTTAPDAKLTIVGETASAITTWYNSLGTQTAVFDESFADFSVPTSFGAVGDTTINGDLNFADLNYSKITSQGDLYITAGSAFRDSNIYLEPLGRGEVFASSNLLVDGDVEASGTFVSDAGFDLAEVYDTYNAELEPGDLVMIAGDMGGATGGTDSGSSGGATVEKANFMKRDSLVGIVSTKPGFTLGGGAFKEQVKSAEANPEEATKTPVLIALAGRVPVKVSLENGEIKAGDALTIGFIDGVAAKARTNGMIVARALEGYTLADKAEGKETIIAMVQTNWWQSSGGQTAEDFALDWEIASSNLAVIQEATQGMSGTTSYTSGSSSTNTEDSGVLGESTFYNTSITGDLTVGLLKVDSLENSIGIIGAPCYNAQTGVTNQDLCQTQTLYLQKGLSGGVDMFNGRIEFNPNGTIKAKSIYADVVEAKEFRAAGNVGVATIKAGTTEFFVENKSTAGASRVFVTPNSPVVVAVKKLEAGKGFVLEINEALSKDLKVDWWLIN